MHQVRTLKNQIEALKLSMIPDPKKALDTLETIHSAFDAVDKRMNILERRLETLTQKLENQKEIA